MYGMGCVVHLSGRFSRDSIRSMFLSSKKRHFHDWYNKTSQKMASRPYKKLLAIPKENLRPTARCGTSVPCSVHTSHVQSIQRIPSVVACARRVKQPTSRGRAPVAVLDDDPDSDDGGGAPAAAAAAAMLPPPLFAAIARAVEQGNTTDDAHHAYAERVLS
eukprot:gene14370-biopygen11146